MDRDVALRYIDSSGSAWVSDGINRDKVITGPVNIVGGKIDQGICGLSAAAPCFWCGGQDRQLIAVRGDDVKVMECRLCRHRAVHQVTIDLDEVYQDDSYFQKESQPAVETTKQSKFGYTNYEQISFADWNAEFFSALFLLDDLGAHSGSLGVLDVGCATGTFLDMVKSFGYKTLGLEPSLWAQKKCIEKGHQIAAGSIETLNVPETNVDLITAFHVVEHLVDFNIFFDATDQCIQNGSKLLAVFPNVNFQQENWSGKHDSFEHISYFSHDFVDREFRKRLPVPFEVLSGPDLVFCFAGKLSRGQQNAIAAVREIIAEAGFSEGRRDWLRKRLESLNLPSLVFVINFLARNHSSAVAREILEAVKSLPQWQEEPAWLSLCYGLVHRQNGNVYGAANYLGQVVPNQLELSANSHRGMVYLKDLIQKELPALLLNKSDAEYPVINIWVNDAHGSADIEALFRSIGEQTYPHIQVLVLSGDGSQKKTIIPEQYQKLVPVIETAGRSTSDVWQETCSKSKGEIVLLTNGRYTLSEYCLFAMYYPLIKNPNSIVTAGVRDSLAAPVKLFPGQRLIERLIGKQLVPPKDSSKAPPFVMFNRNTVSWADVDLGIVGDPIGFRKYLQEKPVVVCPDVLGWLKC